MYNKKQRDLIAARLYQQMALTIAGYGGAQFPTTTTFHVTNANDHVDIATNGGIFDLEATAEGIRQLGALALRIVAGEVETSPPFALSTRRSHRLRVMGA